MAVPTSLRILAAGVLAAGVALIAGCSTVGYYVQSIHGHFAMLHAARPIHDIVADPAVEEPLKQRLQRAQRIRTFASTALALPDNRSYRSYADLQRPFVVWNVFAAPELSLDLKHWCYPVVGCAAYRGYFNHDAADRVAAQLRADGYEVNVGGVAAYSTLGWFADPLLNTFISGTEGQLAGLIFHELSHQVVFVGGDTTFNESFATSVEREGVRRWLAVNGDEASRRAYLDFAQRRSQFLDLLLKYRESLAQNYLAQQPDDVKRARKQQLLSMLKVDYARLRATWGGFAGYDRFFAQDLNNAHLAAVATYNDWVPAFERLLAQNGGDFARFYEQVKDIAAMPKQRRDDLLRSMLAQR
ncbi:MAG: aminopeptidase [Burkholderiaceae bacterium]